jgi:hypothetical protein
MDYKIKIKEKRYCIISHITITKRRVCYLQVKIIPELTKC